MDISDRLSEQYNRAVEPEEIRRGAGKRLFLAQKNEIIQSINDGWSYKDIHALLHKENQMPITYRVFCLYVHEYITSKANGGENQSQHNNGVEVGTDKSVAENTSQSQRKKPVMLDEDKTGFIHSAGFEEGKSLV